MQVGEICNRAVVTILKGASILEVVREMRTDHIGDVIVTDRVDGTEKPIGIITDRDIVVELLAKKIDLDTVNVADVMSLTLFTAQPDAELFDTLRFMSTEGIRRVPLVDEAGALYGILSLNDITAVLTNELSLITNIATRQFERERSVRT